MAHTEGEDVKSTEIYSVKNYNHRNCYWTQVSKLLISNTFDQEEYNYLSDHLRVGLLAFNSHQECAFKVAFLVVPTNHILDYVVECANWIPLR